MLLPEGLIPGAYTPFTSNGRLNEKQLAEELRLVSRKAGGLLGPATHSEYVSLTPDEWKTWIDVNVDVARSANIKSWVFLGSESFEKTIDQATYAVKAGADGMFVLAPYFNHYGQETAYEYYRDIAGAFSDTPIVMYPSHLTGNHFTPATIARIAEIPNIVSIKLAPDTQFAETARMLLLTEDNKQFQPVAGGLPQLWPLLAAADIKASCSTLSNVAPDLSINLWEAYVARDWPNVAKWNRKLIRIAGVLGGVPGYPQVGHKAAIRLLGRDVGEMRRPGPKPTEEHIARIRKVFEEEGLLDGGAARAA
jgi:4-hydroxy-tetrahydrodipicolinate synthase